MKGAPNHNVANFYERKLSFILHLPNHRRQG